MREQKRLKERRKHQRFKVRQPAFAFFDVEPVKLREILDISLSGLSFSYLDNQAKFLFLDEVRYVSIASGIESKDICLEKLPFRVVSEQTMAGYPPSPIKRKRYGLQFTELTPDQRVRLEAFIQHNNAGAV